MRVAMASRRKVADKAVNVIVAYGRNREIGRDGKLPWEKIHEDMDYFHKMTTKTNDSKKSNAVIMGRKTWESLPVKTLPHRTNVVITSNQNHDDGVCDNDIRKQKISTSNFIGAIDEVKQMSNIENIWVIGGQSIYKDALDICDNIYATEIDAEFPKSDTFFPEIPKYMKREIITKSNCQYGNMSFVKYTAPRDHQSPENQYHPRRPFPGRTRCQLR